MYMQETFTYSEHTRREAECVRGSVYVCERGDSVCAAFLADNLSLAPTVRTPTHIHTQTHIPFSWETGVNGQAAWAPLPEKKIPKKSLHSYKC